MILQDYFYQILKNIYYQIFCLILIRSSRSYLFAGLRRSAPQMDSVVCRSQTCTTSTDRIPKNSGCMYLRLHLLLRYVKNRVCVCMLSQEEISRLNRRRPLSSLTHRTREGCSPSLKAIPYQGIDRLSTIYRLTRTLSHAIKETQCGRECGIDRWVNRQIDRKRKNEREINREREKREVFTLSLEKEFNRA